MPLIQQSFWRYVTSNRYRVDKIRWRFKRWSSFIGKTCTGKPIKYIGVSEKVSGLEVFYPERISSRILGMGDIVGLVEEAQKNVDIKEAEKIADKLKSGKNFDLDDFKNQIGQMKKMGGVGAMMDKMPSQLVRQCI